MKKRLLIFVLIALSSIGVPGRESDEIIGKEIAKVFENSGEQGLILWMKKNKDRVSRDIIEAFAQASIDRRLEKALTIALVLAQEQNHQYTLAKVYRMAGDFFLVTWDFQQATGYYNKALSHFEKLNNFNGQGDIYFNLANIYYAQQRYTEAIEGCRKAAFYFNKSGSLKKLEIPLPKSVLGINPLP